MYRLIHYHGGERRQIALDPEKGELTIGRLPELDVIIADASVSRKHARVFLDANGSPWIEDLKSINGTFLEGERISRHQLHSGADIRCGHVHLIFLSAPSDELARQLEEESGWEPKSGEMQRRTTAPGSIAAAGNPMRAAVEELVERRRKVGERHREIADLYEKLAGDLELLISAEEQFSRFLGAMATITEANPYIPVGPKQQTLKVREDDEEDEDDED